MENGTIVVFGFGFFGVILEKFLYNGEFLYNVHYLDAKTGKLLKCPDSRCDSKSRHCPICGRNLHLGEMVIIPKIDLDFYVKENFIHLSLAQRHNKVINQ